MSQKPAVSVLTVSYRSADYIQAFLEALYPQLEQVKGELILVDNASDDDTVAVIEAWLEGKQNVQFIPREHNNGFAMGNNQALKHANGEHILLLNPDTEIQAGTLAGLLAELNDPQLGAVAPQLIWPDGRIQFSCRRFPTHWNIMTQILGLAVLFPESRWANSWKMGDFDHTQLRDVDQPAAAALLIRGDLYRELGGLDPEFPMFFNDVDLCRRITDRGFKIRFQPKWQVVHRGGASIRTDRIRMVVSSQMSFFRYFTKTFTRVHHQIPNLFLGLALYVALIPRVFLALFPATRRERTEL